MLENLINLVKENAGDSIINNPAIPNERNDEAVGLASSSILDTLKGAIAGGNINDVVGMFTNGNNAGSSPLAENMKGGFVQNLMEKFGLDSAQAANIANNLIPNILGKFVHKTNDPNDNSFDLQDILQKVSGGSAGGLNIQDVLSKFNNGKDGGIMDTVKGFFN
ncbi:DUF937 domain-containing protein [Panacibacter sp. DH6]|uniref:DUF937 domain-containing protein n=1 Tax=Panacibacter microcysteis TaxID=2793269 RepID=A0A931GT87_9BACT|nr:DUF937 domain-containing protein [Panacibacter microcysteis]MBG9375266.1 DUF937 domain-containing protein [Panacibacter microcysteis]